MNLREITNTAQGTDSALTPVFMASTAKSPHHNEAGLGFVVFLFGEKGETMEDEIIFTDADRRLCNQEVADLWQRADSNPKFDKTMDNVVEELTKHGVDVSMINQAASSLD